MKKISVVIPMYNEEEVVKTSYLRVEKVLKELKQYDYEMIIIDDGSKDKTLDLLRDIAHENEKVKVLSFSRNFGHQAAVTAGIQYVTGDAVIIIDADLQDPPELIPEMIALWEEGNEVIYGQRRSRKGESAFKLLTAKMFYHTLNALSDVEIPKDTGDFRLVDKRVIDVINAMPEHNKFLRGLFSWVGFQQIPFEYERKERFAGKTKYPLKKMLKLGFITIIFSIVILIYSLVSYAFELNHLTPGWTSIMVAITLFSGVQLVSIWIISEYMARIYDETRHRPEYIIDQKINIE